MTKLSRIPAIVVTFAALVALTGCASVDFDYPKVESVAISETDTTETYLGKQVAELRMLREDIQEHQRQRYWLTATATGVISGTLLLALKGNVYLAAALYAIAAVAAFAARPRRD